MIIDNRIRDGLAGRSTLAATLGFLLLAAYGCTKAQNVKFAFGPEVTASVNADGGRLRVEPSAVIAGDMVLVAWNDSRAGRDFKVRTGVGIGWSKSTDGGRSFTFGGYLPSFETPDGQSGADSWLTVTSAGDVLLQVLHWGKDEQQVLVYSLERRGETTWTIRGSFAEPKIDKPAMATAGDNWVGIAYTAGSAIRFARSTNAGRTWAAPLAISATDARTRTGAGIAACRDQVLVAWLEGEGITLDEVWSAWSVDGGKSFSTAKVRKLDGSVTPPPGYALGVGPAGFIGNNAWVACSDGTSPLFHITYAEGRRAGSAILYQQARLDGSQVDWRQPAIVAGGDGVWAVFPSVAVFDQGLVGILYYDSRHSEASRPLMDVYLSIGSPGRFEDHRLTTVSTSWPDVPGDREHAPFQRNFGDYITLTAHGRRGLAVWTDGRTGKPEIMTRLFSLGLQ